MGGNKVNNIGTNAVKLTGKNVALNFHWDKFDTIGLMQIWFSLPIPSKVMGIKYPRIKLM